MALPTSRRSKPQKWTTIFEIGGTRSLISRVVLKSGEKKFNPSLVKLTSKSAATAFDNPTPELFASEESAVLGEYYNKKGKRFDFSVKDVKKFDRLIPTVAQFEALKPNGEFFDRYAAEISK